MRNEESRIREMTIGERIRYVRRLRRMSQEDLATALYTKKQTISAYENNKLELKVSVLIAIAAALDVTASYLLNESETIKVCTSFEGNTSVMRIVELLTDMDDEMKAIALKQIEALSELR